MTKCPICLQEFDDGGNYWKKVCYSCYKDYRNWSRINKYDYQIKLYLTHPSATKEEIDKWIKNKGLERGWGVEEWKPENYDKFKIWIDNVNFD